MKNDSEKQNDEQHIDLMLAGIFSAEPKEPFADVEYQNITESGVKTTFLRLGTVFAVFLSVIVVAGVFFAVRAGVNNAPKTAGGDVSDGAPDETDMLLSDASDDQESLIQDASGLSSGNQKSPAAEVFISDSKGDYVFFNRGSMIKINEKISSIMLSDGLMEKSDIISPVLSDSAEDLFCFTIWTDGMAKSKYAVIYNFSDLTYKKCKLSTEPMMDTSFSIAGNAAAAADGNERLNLYDFTTGIPKNILDNKDNFNLFNPIEFSKTGRFVRYELCDEGGSRKNGTAMLNAVYDRSTEKTIRFTGLFLRFTADEKYILAKNNSGYVKVDTATGQVSKISSGDPFAEHDFYITTEYLNYPRTQMKHSRVNLINEESKPLSDNILTVLCESPDGKYVFVRDEKTGKYERIDILTLEKTVLNISAGSVKPTDGKYGHIRNLLLTEKVLYVDVDTDSASYDDPADMSDAPEQAIASDWFKKYDSIADMVRAYPQFLRNIKFYQGSQYAYIELRDDVCNNLSVVFEDYRTGKIYTVTHNERGSFSIFHIDMSYLTTYESRDSINIKPLGKTGTMQEFLKVADVVNKPVYDYSSFIKSDGTFDRDKMCALIYDRQRMLDELVFCTVMKIKGDADSIGYFSNDKEYLNIFLNLYYSKSEQTVSVKDMDAVQECYNISLHLGDVFSDNENYSSRSFYVYKCKTGKYYIGCEAGNKYISEEEFKSFEKWAEVYAKMTGDYEPLKK